MSNSRWMSTLAADTKRLTRCSPDWTTLTCLGLAARRNGAKRLRLNGSAATTQVRFIVTFKTFRSVVVTFHWKGSEQFINFTSKVLFCPDWRAKSWKSTKVDLRHLKKDGLILFELIRLYSTFKINYSLKQFNLELWRIFSKHNILVHFKPNRILRQKLVHLKAWISLDYCWGLWASLQNVSKCLQGSQWPCTNQA